MRLCHSAGRRVGHTCIHPDRAKAKHGGRAHLDCITPAQAARIRLCHDRAVAPLGVQFIKVHQGTDEVALTRPVSASERHDWRFDSKMRPYQAIFSRPENFHGWTVSTSEGKVPIECPIVGTQSVGYARLCLHPDSRGHYHLPLRPGRYRVGSRGPEHRRGLYYGDEDFAHH